MTDKIPCNTYKLKTLPKWFEDVQDMTNGQRVLEEIIRRHGSNRFRIAFCPYKAEMWDAMESIFEACIFESNIKPVICPIPFAEFDFKGNLGLYRTEASRIKEMTAYVNHFVSPEQLDGFKPDYIVLHYPYDDKNTVTRIDKEFLSVNLMYKGYKIIYTPYALPYGGTSTCDLTKQPVLKHSWLIVQDSEEEKQNVINAWKKENIDLSDKIIVTGSPKRDCLLDAEETGVTNTVLIAGSLIPLLNGMPKKLLAYQRIIEAELALNKKIIYRYHPLSTTGFLSKLPAYYPQWINFLGWCQTLTEKYDFKFDDNLRIQDTMNLCDYMYADGGSAVELWKGTKKPYEVIVKEMPSAISGQKEGLNY